MTSHRTRTRSKTRSWQLSAVLLAGGAAALGFLPLAKYFGPGGYIKPGAAENASRPQPLPPLASEDAAQLATRMNRLAGKVEVKPPEPEKPEGPEVAGGGAPPPPEPPKPPPSDWVYKSYLGSPRLKAAAVVINEQQMLVCEGRSYDTEKHSEVPAGTANAIKVVEVRPTHLTVEENGAPRQIDLAARVSNGYPTDAAGRRPPPMAAGARPGMQPGQPNAPFNPAVNQPGMARGMSMASPMPSNPNFADQMRHGMPAPTAADDVATMMKEKFEGMSQEKRDMFQKVIGDQSLDPQERWKMLEEAGLSPKNSPEERVQFLRNFGITPENDPKLYEHVKSGGGGGK